jgi:CheY-like chemotaxis protein
MLKILIVDDRAEARKLLREIIEVHLPEGANVEVEDTFPLEDVHAYASHVREHDVNALLLDEMLHEQKDPASGKYVPYFGHDVVGHLRAALPDFPVYVVTTYKPEHALVEKEAQFDDIIERDDFQKSPQKFTDRIQRAASRFQEAMQQHLVALSELALKAADGKLTKDEQTKLISTREILGLPFTSDSDLVVSDLIAEARVVVAKSEELLRRLKDQGAKK